MKKSRQANLNNKQRKKNEAKKQQIVERKQQALTQQRNDEYRRASRSREVYLDSIVPRNHEGRRQIFASDPALDISFGVMLGAFGFFGREARISESRQVQDLSNTIDHNPNEFKE